MPDESSYYTCTSSGDCQPCTSDELTQIYCQTSGYKQPVVCKWNDGVSKEYQDTHTLPKYTGCSSLDDLSRRAFFRNQFIFVVLGLAAFVVYLWRRRKLVGSSIGSGSYSMV